MKIIRKIITFLICTVGTAQAATFDRGNGLIYDDVLDITWLQNANLGAGSIFDDGSNNTDGRMTWNSAVAWADDLSFGGFDDWRLASMSVAGGLPTGSGSGASIVDCSTATELSCRDNELGYMFYQNLVGNSGDNLIGNQGLFENISVTHWSGTELAPNPVGAFFFVFNNGTPLAGGKQSSALSAWAVRSGDISATVPEPATAMLLGLGLLGWMGAANRKR